MTYSMTAFTRVQKQLDAGILCWEIKSVNHRYLDVSFRLPEVFRFLETSLRSMMRGKISRGKLECQLKFQSSTTDAQSIRIDDCLINSLIAAGNQLATTRQLPNDLTLSTILSWPGVIQTSQSDQEALSQQVELLFQETLAQLLAVRKSEGQALRLHIQSRLDKLQDEIKVAWQLVAPLTEQIKDKLLTRLHVLQLEVDKTRVEQELALQLARLDVTEELDRLQTHVVEVEKVLQREEAIGRRLDFLMQELNREANTLSSKSESVALTQSAVEMKVLIEQMREQIQNIE
ncbi:YicC/YloC family endoribonuclease [Legionella feeleii]|uniref:Putative stress-induced protein n=1 Tax=Legionella feeleii TaxID=453 RepID=A0A0W0TK73_9GAMM|nr:YicC/YloC family endoribonuclease [Legionella feeleii]KTC95915.1 putative stress-induced protein [Legionella feeleii]SPX60326.1 putative stress-induced protein [Legionella feeleii]